MRFKYGTNNLESYNVGDSIQYLIDNCQTSLPEWRYAKVVDTQIVYPSGTSKFKPYTVLVVEVDRTYCHCTPQYSYLSNGVKVFEGNKELYYKRKNKEIVLNYKLVKPLG